MVWHGTALFQHKQYETSLWSGLLARLCKKNCVCWPEVKSWESETYEEGDTAGGDLHVPGVGDPEDDEQ